MNPDVADPEVKARYQAALVELQRHNQTYELQSLLRREDADLASALLKTCTRALPLSPSHSAVAPAIAEAARLTDEERTQLIKAPAPPKP
jgi:hypothetical protein